jgi:hypothetical protein
VKHSLTLSYIILLFSTTILSKRFSKLNRRIFKTSVSGKNGENDLVYHHKRTAAAHVLSIYLHKTMSDVQYVHEHGASPLKVLLYKSLR